MAQVDTSIYNALLRPVKSVAEYDAEAMQGQQNKLALQMNRDKAAEFQRERAGENKLAQLLAGGGTADQIGADLARSGYAKQALAFTKQQQDIAKSKADAMHTDAQTGKLKSETGKLDYEQREAKRQKAISDIASFTSGEQALTSLALHEQAGDIDPQQAALIRQTVPANPADFPKWQIGMLQRIMSAKDSAGQIAPDANARLQADTSTSNNQATIAARRAEAAAERAQSDRQFNARENRERQTPRGQIVQTDDGLMLVDPRSGKSQPVTGPTGAPMQPKLKQVPATISKALLENKASLRTVNKAIAALDAYPDAFGAKNYLGDEIRQRTDPKGITARAYTADIGSLKIHDRSGAAVTAAETPRLKPFIPAATDNPATVRKKLMRFKEEYEAIQADLGETYSREQGYRAGGGAAAATGVDALLEKYGD